MISAPSPSSNIVGGAHPYSIPQRGALVHQEWRAVIPPSDSRSHPTVFLSFHAPASKRTKKPATPRKPSALAALPSPDIGSEASGSTLVASEIFYSGEGVRGSPRPLDKGKFKVIKASSDGAASPRLDRYASTYHPLWLRSLPPPTRVFQLPPTPPFPSPDYATAIFTPRQILTPFPNLTPMSSILAHAPYEGETNPLDASRAVSEPHYYAAHFTALLSLVLQAQVEEMERALIHMVSLHVHDQSGGTYRLHIPGIREDSPHLTIGDRLVLRGLYSEVRRPGPVAVEAEVIGLVKAKGWVYVRAPHLAGVDASLPKVAFKVEDSARVVEGSAAMYQVEFRVSAAPLCIMQDALRTFSLALDRSSSTEGPSNIARRWLFPEIRDVVRTKSSATAQKSIAWIDEALNEEQKDAVQTIVSDDNARVLFLVSGPPGVSRLGCKFASADVCYFVLRQTGKTKTLVEAVLQVLRHDPHANVLVCAPSNPAADILARRLGRVLGRSEMLRLNAPNRTFAEVPDEVMLYCCVRDNQFELPLFEQLMQFKVVVCGCLDAGILVTGRATNTETMRAESELFVNLHPGGVKGEHRIFPHWSHLMIDEAGQASEPEVLIPLSVVLPLPLPNHLGTQDPLVVLCGDVHQLGPVIPSQDARDGELDISLLERLFQRDVYAAHPKAKINLSKAAQRLARTVAESYRPPFTNLVKNYRSIAPILMVPAALFYEDTLQPAAQDVSLIRWSGLPNPKIPILFHGCETEEDWIEEGASWFNEGEILAIVDIVQSLLAERPDIRQEQIAVITPWREHVWRTRAQLRRAGFGGIDVGNVETYQGGEFRITIVSCVRSRSRFLPDDRKANMGLFNERKRFNVAITRAKELLIVVGNANLLKGDPFWNGFLQIMLRNNLYRGPDVRMEMTGAYVSRLESLMRDQENLEDDEAGLLLAGAMARETLRDG